MTKQEQPEYNLNEKFYIFDKFLTSNKHILERGDKDWDSSKIFFQLSIEHADNSPLTKDAEKYEDGGKVDWSFLKDDNRKDKFVILPRLQLFEIGNKNKFIYQYINIENKYLLISLQNFISKKSTLKLFDLDSYSYEVIDTYNYKQHQFVFEKDEFIIFCYVNGMVRFFDKNKLEFIFEKKILKDGEEFEENEEFKNLECIQIKNSGNKIEDESVEKIVPEDHSYYIINEFAFIYNDKTRSNDKTIKVYNKNSLVLLGTLDGHSREGLRFIKLLNNRLLTIAVDSIIKVWSLNDFSLLNSWNITFPSLYLPYYDEQRNLLFCTFNEEFSVYDLNFKDINIQTDSNIKFMSSFTRFSDDEIAICRDKKLEILNTLDLTKNKIIQFQKTLRPLSEINFKSQLNKFFLVQTLDNELIVKDYKSFETLCSYKMNPLSKFEIVGDKHIVISNKKELLLLDIFKKSIIDTVEFEFPIKNLKLVHSTLIISSKLGHLVKISIKNNKIDIESTIKTNSLGMIFNEYSSSVFLETEDHNLYLYINNQEIFFEHPVSAYKVDINFYDEKVITVQDNLLRLWSKKGTLIYTIEFHSIINLNSINNNIVTVLTSDEEFGIVDMQYGKLLDKFPINNKKSLQYYEVLVGKQKKSNVCKQNTKSFLVKTSENIIIFDKSTGSIIYWYPTTLSQSGFKIIDVNDKYFIFLDLDHIKYFRIKN